jgi:hypothetical protein
MDKVLASTKVPEDYFPAVSIQRPKTSFSLYDSSKTAKFKNFSLKYNHSKDPTLKSRRFDYRIFFSKGKKVESERKDSILGRKKIGNFGPARFCSVRNSLSKGKGKVVREIGSDDDLQLIKNINFDKEMQEFKNVKVYRSYVLNFQTPTGTEVFGDRHLKVGTHKKVRFNII